MATSVNVKEASSLDRPSSQDGPSLQDRIRTLAKDGTGAVIGFMIALGLLCVVANMIFNSRANPVKLEEAGQFLVGP